MKKSAATFFTFAFMSFSLGLMAQERSFTTDPIKVIKAYEPVLADLQKVTTRPALPEVSVEKPEMTYKPIPIPVLKVDKELQPLQANKANKLVAPPINGNFLMAGYGNYNAPLVNMHLMSVRNQNTEYGLDLMHFSANGNINYEQERFEQAIASINRFGAYAKTNAFNHLLHAKINYDRLGSRYFGFDRNRFTYNPDSLKQIYNTFSTQLGIASNNAQPDAWQYNANLGFYNLNDSYKQSENNFRLDAGVAKNLGENRFSATLAYDFTGFKHDTSKLNRSLLLFNPAYEIKSETFKLRIGLSTAFQSLPDSSRFHLYPDVVFNMPLAGEQMQLEVGVGGSLQRIGWNTLVQRNPFIGQQLQLGNVNEALSLYAHLHGKLSDASTYKIYTKWQNMKNAIFFLNDPENFTRILPIYEKNASRLDIGAHYQFDLFKQFSVLLGTEARIFMLDSLEKPWNEPTLILNSQLNYQLSEKLKLKADIHAFNAVSVLILTPNPEVEGRGKLNGVVDISFGADYQFAKNISVWLQANNLASMRYFRYFNYPTYGMNFMGGFTFSL